MLVTSQNNIGSDIMHNCSVLFTLNALSPDLDYSKGLYLLGLFLSRPNILELVTILGSLKDEYKIIPNKS